MKSSAPWLGRKGQGVQKRSTHQFAVLQLDCPDCCQISQFEIVCVEQQNTCQQAFSSDPGEPVDVLKAFVEAMKGRVVGP